MTSIEELAEPVRKARTPSALDVLKAAPRDGDGDGIINEGLPSERHVLSQSAVTRMAQAFRLTQPVRVIRGRIGESRLIEGGKNYATYQGVANGVHQIMVHADAPRTGMLAYLAHEMMHAKQYERIGSSFMETYKKLHVVHGYRKNPLEVEAIKASAAFMRYLEGNEELFKALPRDGDGDGMIYDGTPMERPAPGRGVPGDHPGLPVLPWRDPPPARGKPGERRAGGFAANGKTATEEGDLGEKIRDHLNLKPAQEGRVGALDAIAPGWGYEIKTRTVESTGYRVGMKTKEMNEKRAEAERLNVRPGLILVVIDGQTAYVYHRPGIFNGKLDDSFSFAGVVKL